MTRERVGGAGGEEGAGDAAAANGVNIVLDQKLIADIKALRASHPIFARNSIRIVSEYKCQGQGRDVTVTVPFAYKME